LQGTTSLLRREAGTNKVPVKKIFGDPGEQNNMGTLYLAFKHRGTEKNMCSVLSGFEVEI
jgi:hypothetical protein